MCVVCVYVRAYMCVCVCCVCANYVQAVDISQLMLKYFDYVRMLSDGIPLAYPNQDCLLILSKNVQQLSCVISVQICFTVRSDTY